MRGVHRRPSRRLSVALLALVLLAAALVALRAVGGTAAAGTVLAKDGRIAYGGTLHRSIGVVDPANSAAGVPYFPGGPQHYDDEVSARGDALVWTSLRDSPFPEVWYRQGDGPLTEVTTASATGVLHPVLSPDGRRIAFAATTGRTDDTSKHDIWVVATDGTGLHRLTDGTGDNTWPTWSPDGTAIAFSADRGASNGVRQIYRIPSAGGPVQQITFDHVNEYSPTLVFGNTEPSWDPVVSHDRLLYTSNLPVYENGQPLSVRQEISVRTLATGVVLALPQAMSGSHSGSWSPDGCTVAFVAPSAGQQIDQIWTVTLPTSSAAAASVLRLSEDRQDGDPTWYTPAQGAPELLVTRDTAATAATVDLCDITSGGYDPRDLLVPVRDLNLDQGIGDESQQYAPDGLRIAFTKVVPAADARPRQVWVADADGTHARPLETGDLRNGESDTDPAWSPDGTRIALTRSAAAGHPESQIVVVDSVTGRQLLAVPQPDLQADSRPAFSPDGHTLVFTRADQRTDIRRRHIWSADADDGSAQRDLSAVDDPDGVRARDDGAAFSPDGRSLVFQTGGPVGLMDADGQHARTVPDPLNRCNAAQGEFSSAACLNPTWSPDGLWLLADTQSLDSSGNYDAATTRLAVVRSYGTTGWGSELTGPQSAFQGNQGQQAKPSWQPTANLATALVTAPHPTVAGGRTSLLLDVTNQGRVTDPGVRLTLAVPTGLRLTALTPTSGSCLPAQFQCELGSLALNQLVQVRVDLAATASGSPTVTWTTTGLVLDPDPTDNHASAQVEVGDPPSPSPTPTPPPPPLPDPAVRIALAPAPAYVGGAVTVTYTVTNLGGRPATGIQLLPVLAPDTPVAAPGWPAGCGAATGCPIGDLAPGGSAVVQLVVTPTAAGNPDLAATLTTTGPDAVPGNDRADQALQVRQPAVAASPLVGTSGSVTLVRGHDFPPGVPVTLTWQPGITATAAPVVPGPDGSFTAQLLVLSGDAPGMRSVVAGGAGFGPVRGSFLVVPEPSGPPLFFTDPVPGG
ncbi:Tol biopolymer transport system component [Kitasatospora sp. MAA4]|uniref:hypothetical protein n=1 Tax=Kitasatospora sp. MAA4 TaxID=3035093 RepID=UPI0024744298|nr:hypothetical protein [Kitasatospora sp. MAA4]MDH6137736.1 Tol biopolymer transport system component [Kitasatospora sp. MAA4]